MTNPVEPTDVGPAVGGHLEVADADRQHVITLLTAAHAEGLLSAADRDQRIAAARSAEIFDDLVPLTRDLVKPDAPAAVHYDQEHPNQTADQVVAIFGGASRSGQWRVRPATSILTLFGGADLDLTHAVFEAQRISVTVFCLFGGVDLTVPSGTIVENNVIAIFGGSDVHRLDPPIAGAPTIVLKGFAGFGGISVRNPRQGHLDRERDRAAARQLRSDLRHGEQRRRGH